MGSLCCDGPEPGADVPFIVIWLIGGGLFFTFYLKFINFRGLNRVLPWHLARQTPCRKGRHFAFSGSCHSSVLDGWSGNIAGVAVAISMGGPGATFWMIVAGLLGMSSKFAECTLGVKYRRINEQGQVSGGPMYYLLDGLKERGLPRTGKFLSYLYGITIALSAFGIGNMFQSNQNSCPAFQCFSCFDASRTVDSIALAILTGLVILGGIRSIAKVCGRLFPVMAGIYIIMCLLIILSNIGHIGEAFRVIWDGAFSPEAAKGGFVGVLIMGFRRAVFSNEAGIGSAAIAHSSVKTKEPVTEGYVALLEPFIDTVLICTLTALSLIFTGVYQNPGQLEGAQLTSAAFATLAPWAPYVLLLCTMLFVYSP